MLEAQHASLRLRARVAGAPLDVPERTVVDAVAQAARDHGARAAFLVRPAPGEPFAEVTWSQAHARMERVAQGLLSLGLAPSERVAIVSETRPEWTVADLAIAMAGGVSVTAFATLPSDAVAHLLEDSGATVAFVENAEQLAKARAQAARLGRVRHWVTFEPVEPGDDEIGKRTMTLADLEEAGRRHAEREPDAVQARVAQLKPEHPYTIIPTSGSTGKPKGVVLTHRNLIANAVGSIQHLRLNPHPRGLAFLPLAHSYQRQSAVVLALLAGTAAFSAPSRLAEDLRAVRPTLLPAVPRLYERLYERIHEGVRQQPKRRQRIFHAAAATAVSYAKASTSGRPPSLGLRLRHALFERLVYARIRSMAGLDQLEMGISGAAALRPELLHFFLGIGIRIVEGYGLTETAAPATVNPPDAIRPGTVGTPLPGVEVALAEDGEVLLRGPNVFGGYHGRIEETREAFAFVDGHEWFRSGDLGELDSKGYLRIVDRKKELEVLDTGKKVAPMLVEERLKDSPFIAEAFIFATGQKFVRCLVQPDFERLIAWAREQGIPVDDARVERKLTAAGEEAIVRVGADLAQDPRVRELYQREVEKANEALAAFEQVKDFRVLNEAFLVETGELTPTLKKRRRAILERRRPLLEAMLGHGRAR